MSAGYDATDDGNEVDQFDMHNAYVHILRTLKWYLLKKKYIKKHINLVPAVTVHSTERIFLLVSFRSYRSLTYWCIGGSYLRHADRRANKFIGLSVVFLYFIHFVRRFVISSQRTSST